MLAALLAAAGETVSSVIPANAGIQIPAAELRLRFRGDACHCGHATGIPPGLPSGARLAALDPRGRLNKAATLFFAFLTCASITVARAVAAPPSAAVQIADQERAFAAMCVAKGMRASFSEYFAPDAIDFEPQPARAAASLPKNPDGSASFTLDWEPWIADASAAGDLGWDTGPYRLTPKDRSRPAGQGWFFSVWRRQPDGRWKVAMDVGTKTPASPGHLRPARLVVPAPPLPPATRVIDAGAETAALLARDRESAGAKSPDDLWLPGARLHRDGSLPVAGIHLIGEQTAHRGPFRTAPSGGGVAASGDLGYTYGSYAITGLSADAGYYARVWRRTADGVWKIAAQVERPVAGAGSGTGSE